MKNAFYLKQGRMGYSLFQNAFTSIITEDNVNIEITHFTKACVPAWVPDQLNFN